ncbi:hypothetical protein GCM10007332_12950 [Epilithonimonas arachidiradicis]|uniref:Uncharacterized protein n=1 Tax=Epilithonimonas arachidiradicis TaxID=1617282 RepID=A0ABQ1X3T7_9FLAO|nr:hypothetical protein GCM10007332_12950 [Epilithonimonas arachidiradicis]
MEAFYLFEGKSTEQISVLHFFFYFSVAENIGNNQWNKGQWQNCKNAKSLRNRYIETSHKKQNKNTEKDF